MADANDLPEGYVFEEMVCTGRTRIVGGKAAVALIDARGERGVYAPDRKTLSRLVGGNVYAVPVNAKREVILGRAKRLRLHGNADERAAWQIAEHALEVEREAERVLAKLKQRDDIGEILLPIRKAYAKGDRWTRCAIEALVLQALRNPID